MGHFSKYSYPVEEVIDWQEMASVNVKQYKPYEQLHFPGPSIDYNVSWLC